jgi:ParB-like chromosome segregation protein Spo0J
VAGHHRKAAVGLAGLVTVPCWVREMDDEEAFMALVLANSQSELSPLERGIHALKATRKGQKGESVNAYAKAVERPQRTVAQEVAAAKVAQASAHALTPLIPFARHLAELHVAPSWLWPALIARLIAEAWNVDAARSHAGRLEDLPRDLPSWVDREALAKTFVEGTVRPGDVARVIGAAVRATDSVLLPRLGRRQGVAAALQVDPANDGQAGEGALDILLRVPAGERRHDRGRSSCHEQPRLVFIFEIPAGRQHASRVPCGSCCPLEPPNWGSVLPRLLPGTGKTRIAVLWLPCRRVACTY